MLLFLTTADTEILAAAKASEALPEGFPEVRCTNPVNLADSRAFLDEALPLAHPAWKFAGRGEEGFVAGGVHASYLHTHWAATPGLARRFVRSAALGREHLAGTRA
ncbi:MAG: hypothetical protein M3P37_07455 [Actinomycetota bacterium]|nr:hypothetical protein [Actinomycetota bacterium]